MGDTPIGSTDRVRVLVSILVSILACGGVNLHKRYSYIMRGEDQNTGLGQNTCPVVTMSLISPAD